MITFDCRKDDVLEFASYAFVLCTGYAILVMQTAWIKRIIHMSLWRQFLPRMGKTDKISLRKRLPSSDSSARLTGGKAFTTAEIRFGFESRGEAGVGDMLERQRAAAQRAILSIDDARPGKAQ